MPTAGIRAKMEHETTYLQTSKWHVKNIFMHMGFNYHTDQTVSVTLEKIVSEYDQELPPSQTADNPVAP